MPMNWQSQKVKKNSVYLVSSPYLFGSNSFGKIYTVLLCIMIRNIIKNTTAYNYDQNMLNSIDQKHNLKSKHWAKITVKNFELRINISRLIVNHSHHRHCFCFEAKVSRLQPHLIVYDYFPAIYCGGRGVRRSRAN